MPVIAHIENASGVEEIPDATTMRGWITAALPPNCDNDLELSVRIVDIDEMTELNYQYRHKNKPTNVLSFPAELPDGIDLPLLGDIAICAPVVEQEAREQGKTSAAHWAHMLVHGTLHLRGYDHIDEAEADEMEALETTIMTGLGFPPPYDPTATESANTGERP